MDARSGTAQSLSIVSIDGTWHKRTGGEIVGAQHHAPKGKPFEPRLASILETAEGAAYSSPRRKKTLSLSGDSAFTPREESEQLREAGPVLCNEQLLPFVWNLAEVESKHDFVTCAARGRIKREAKSKAGERHLVRGSWRVSGADT